MQNVAVQQLLPKKWKAVCFCDADIEFSNPSWASDTLKVLNGFLDVLQPFEIAEDLDRSDTPMRLFSSFGSQHAKGRDFLASNKGINLHHPGFCMAMTRAAYKRMSGLFDVGVLGSGDTHMCMGIVGRARATCHPGYNPEYKKTIIEWGDEAKNLRFGYVPGVIRHFFHGSKHNRKYTERWAILTTHGFDPNTHLVKCEHGLIAPSPSCPQGLKDDIQQYFQERKEDD
jgi:hypothetical protein